MSREHLLASVGAVQARLEDPDAELKRLIIVRRLLGASIELDRALREQTRRALVDHCGSRGAQDLGEATEVLVDALVNFGERARELAEYAWEEMPSSAAEAAEWSRRPVHAAR